MKKGYRYECDWWSIGVIMYECIYGFPPFYADDPINTCQKIVRWKHFLQFPHDIPVAPDAVDLLKQFLCDAQKRIGTREGGIAEIKKHPFFANVEWDNIRSSFAPFVPVLKDDLDTSYFDEFDENIVKELQEKSQQQAAAVKKVAYKKGENMMFEKLTFTRDQAQKLKKKQNKLLELFEQGHKEEDAIAAVLAEEDSDEDEAKK